MSRSTERLPTGVPGLDEMIGGGLFAGSTTLIVGMTGAGKTTMALQFALEGVKRGEQTLYVNFQENPAQLGEHISNLGSDPEEARKQGLSSCTPRPSSCRSTASSSRCSRRSSPVRSSDW